MNKETVKIIECVPNFSVGHDKAVIDQIVNSIKNVPSVDVLSYSYDDDHNRLVVTFMGDPDSVFNAAFASIKTASELVDINKHAGVHPFIGATDVVPFIPVKDARMRDCVDLAKNLGKKVAEELKIPVYLYGEASRNRTFKHLYNIRHGGLEHLRSSISTKDFRPDFGPKEIHATAGAVAIGARDYLIAFNVNLETDDLKIAKEIASKIREKNKGLKGIRAIGVPLESKGIVQVSVNVTHYKKTSLKQLMDAIVNEAKAKGVSVRNSEIIGIIPKDATFPEMKQYLMLEDFDDGKIIETYL
ncbi:glutamate formimidoyltransferase [Candidatus Margulisiibacteriota bacterium]